jgi:crotonobetainyl-CoA:carnitine CoA-transferase CaiB-like acyl-CoA transferase
MPARPLRIADFSTHLSGPMASHLLHELGAEVVRIEHPRIGDGNRGLTPSIHGVGDLHVGLSAGVRSLGASIRSPHWPEIVAAATRWADAVIVGARPVDADARGLGFEAIAVHDPRIVYCLVTGYGVAGPWAERTAHGQNVDAWAGRVEVEWEDGQPRTRPGWRSAGTTLAGVFAALGILAAITRRDAGHDGPQFVHTSLWGAAVWWNWRDLNTLANLGHGWNDYADMGSRYATYATADGRALLVCPLEQRFWERFCDLLELPAEVRARGDWSGGMDFGYEDERPTVAERLATRTLDEWIAALEPTEVPFAPVLTLGETLSSEHAGVNAVTRGTRVEGQPVRIAATPLRIADGVQGLSGELDELAPPPRISEHAEEVLTEFGLTHLSPDDLLG